MKKQKKKSIGLKSEIKPTLHVQHIFLYISLPLFFTTSTYPKLPIVYVPKSGTRSCLHSTFFFISLLLILTLLAANICHFCHSQLLIFHVFFFRNELRLLSFFCFSFGMSFALALSLLSASVYWYARSRDYQIFSHLQVIIFSFARARALLILILYYKKWLIINNALFSNSCTVIAEMPISS